MSSGSTAGTVATAAERRALQRRAEPGGSQDHRRLGISIDPQALQAGLALVRQQAQLDEFSRRRDEILNHPAVELQKNRLFAADAQIRHLMAVDRQRLEQINAGIAATRLMNPLLEAQQEHQKRIAAMLHPCRGLLEGLRGYSSGWEQVAAASTASLRRMAEACSPTLPSLDIGLGLDALSSTDRDPHDPVRIHAVPRLPSRSTSRHGGCRQAFQERPSIRSVPEAPSPSASTGWREESFDDEAAYKSLEQLGRLIRSEEIPGEIREGINFLLAVRKLKKAGLSTAERYPLRQMVVDFLTRQLGVSLSDGRLQLLESGLLVPVAREMASVPDLAPEILTTHELAKKLPSTTDTLKRHAKKACAKGPLPQEMEMFPGWFVVSQSDPKGGQGCGWKFRQRLEPQEG